MTHDPDPETPVRLQKFFFIYLFYLFIYNYILCLMYVNITRSYTSEKVSSAHQSSDRATLTG